MSASHRFLMGLAPLLLFAGGCASRDQSSLDPSGIQADRINGLWWVIFSITLAVYLITMAFVVWGVKRRFLPNQLAKDEAAAIPAPEVHPSPTQERRLTRVVGGAVLVSALILFGLILADFATGRALHSLQDQEDLTIKVKAHRWWWEVTYQDPVVSNIFTTANEIHIPVGKVVHFELTSADVIHSFWVPNLHGKKDMIPTYKTHLWLRADEAGTYVGQCAEFCGEQHATMRFLVIAQSDEEFAKWRENQKAPGREPETESQKQGQKVFLTRFCFTCHSIQGTPARASVGPDLTHLASRRKIASNTLPNERGHLGGWIMDPQSIRPGVVMPLNPLKSDELQSLLDYLENLK